MNAEYFDLKNSPDLSHVYWESTTTPVFKTRPKITSHFDAPIHPPEGPAFPLPAVLRERSFSAFCP